MFPVQTGFIVKKTVSLGRNDNIVAMELSFKETVVFARRLNLLRSSKCVYCRLVQRNAEVSYNAAFHCIVRVMGAAL